MVWQVERRGQRSTLVGAAHFFPRHFRRELRRLTEDARLVLLEGPLDEAATRKVLEAGRGLGGGAPLKRARPGPPPPPFRSFPPPPIDPPPPPPDPLPPGERRPPTLRP